MTNREAIEILSRPLFMDGTPKEILDAHRMAISALEKQEGTPDPWDGEKPHAPDGFVKKYCESYTEEEA